MRRPLRFGPTGTPVGLDGQHADLLVWGGARCRRLDVDKPALDAVLPEVLDDLGTQVGDHPQAERPIEDEAGDGRRCAGIGIAEVEEPQIGTAGRDRRPGRLPEADLVLLEALEQPVDARVRIGQWRQDREAFAGRVTLPSLSTRP